MSADLKTRQPVAPRAVPRSAPRVDPERAASVAPWQVSAALGLVLLVATGSLHVLFEDQAWMPVVALAVIAVLGAAAATRSLSRLRFLPSVVAAAVLLGLTTLFFAPETALAGVIPTLGTFERFSVLVAAANESIYRQAIPADADLPIVFVLSLAIGAIALIADLIAITLRAPAPVGALVLGIVAVPAVTRVSISDPVFFVFTAMAYLLLLVVASPRRQPGLALSIGATAILGTLVLPLVLPELEARPEIPSGSSSGVNPVLSLGDDLRRASERTVLDYATASGTPHYLRLVSLERFTGDTWAPTEREIDTENTVDGFGPVPGLNADVAVADEVTEVDIRNLSTEWLPVPYPARSISGLDDDWYWDSEGLSVSSTDDTPRGQEYEVQSLVLQPTPEQLLAAGTTVPVAVESYLDLPDDLPEVISETAASVTADAPTNYERAIALQESFRSSDFVYSEEAPVEGDYDGTGMEIIARFLEERSGYCVHYSSAMAVMARSLGIPARVVVGFLPGTLETGGDGTRYEVTTHDLHSWPELYFDGIGWVQFEPTPGRGELGEYADVENEGVPAPSAPVATPSPTPSPSVAPSTPLNPDAAPELAPETRVQQPAERALPFVLGALGLVLVSLVPAGIRLGQRRRLASRLRLRSATALDAWTEVLRSAADLRMPVTMMATPRETAALLTPSSDSLSRLLAATEEAGYGATTLVDPRSLIDDVDRVRDELQHRADARARFAARFYPASIWRRIAHPFTPPAF